MKHIGGQAVIEGVMMMSENKYAIACRNLEGRIVTTSHRRKESRFKKIPFFRGIVYLIQMLVISTKALTWSANQQGEDGEMGAWELILTFGVAILLTIGIFVLLPYYLAKLFFDPPTFAFNLVDGVFRIAAFFIYLLIIGWMKDVKRMFEYHGAEHMTVHCYESGQKLNVENVMKHKKEHARCGTSLLVFVIIISILMFSLLQTDVWWINIPARIILIPVIAGISYELLKVSAKFKWLSWLSLPGIWTQKLTTRYPDASQVEVAIVALEKVK